MALPIFSEKRLANRKKMTGLLPGRLTLEDGTAVDCIPNDVSPAGLGISSALQMKVNTKLLLHMKNDAIELKVAWTRPGIGKLNQTRYGLSCVKSGVDLEKIFLDTGCLK